MGDGCDILKKLDPCPAELQLKSLADARAKTAEFTVGKIVVLPGVTPKADWTQAHFLTLFDRRWLT